MCGGYRAILPCRPRHFPTPIHLLKPDEGQSGGRMVRDEREGGRGRGRGLIENCPFVRRIGGSKNRARTN